MEASCFRVGNYIMVAVISFYVWNREREIRILDATERKRPNSLVPPNLQRLLIEAQYFSLLAGWSFLPFIYSCISKIKGELLKANHSQFHLQKLIFFSFCLFFCFITLFIYSHIISFNMVDVTVIQTQEFSRMSLHWVCLMFFSTFI